jgi:hypothetical protein
MSKYRRNDYLKHWVDSFTCRTNWNSSSQHQLNTFQSLKASRSMWQKVECKLRYINVKRVSDPRRVFLPAFRVTGRTDYKPGSLWESWRPTWKYRQHVWVSVSNGSRKPASSPEMELKNGLDWFQTHPKTPPTESWQAKLGPIPVNRQASPGLATPVGSNLGFCISGFPFMVALRYATVNHKILTLVRHGSFSTY